MTRAAGLLLAAVLLGGCEREPVARHDVPWYLVHPEARERTLAACLRDPGGRRNDPDCRNAAAASRQAAPRVQDLPPLGLPREAPAPAPATPGP